MKTKIITYVCTTLMIVILTGLVLSPGYSQGSKGPVIKWDPNIRIKSPVGLTLYKLINQRVDVGKFVALSSKIDNYIEPDQKFRLSIRSEDVLTDEDELVWVEKGDPSKFITQNIKNGHFFFQKEPIGYLNMREVDLPSKEVAMSKFKAFINEVGMMPSDFESNGNLFRTGGVCTQVYNDGVCEEKVKLSRALFYERQLNNLPVRGPGSKITCEFGDKGRIISFRHKWNAIVQETLTTQPTPSRVVKPGLKLPGTVRGGKGGTSGIIGDIGKKNLSNSLFLSAEEVKAAITKKILAD